jgi:hypothetical protein
MGAADGLVAQQALPALSRAQNRSGFFFWMSLLILIILLVAFAPSFYLRVFSDESPMPLRLHLHGAVLTAWFVWLVLQTGLIRSGRTVTHKKLGIAGAVLAAAVVIAAPMATLGSLHKFRAAGMNWDSDMSEWPRLGIEGMSLEQFAGMLVWGNFLSIALFAILVFGAITMRRQAETHKRLMLLASITIIGPALARIARWPGLGGEDGAFIPVVFLGLLLSVVAHDVIRTRRVYAVTAVSVVAIIVVLFSVPVIATSDFGRAVVHQLW